jgi:protein O-mannosyl-transferase
VSGARDLRLRAVPLLALAALIGAAYAGSLSAPFVYDDVPSIVENPYLETLWPIGAAVRSPDHVESSFAGRPVASYTLAISHALSGRDPAGYHALQIALHAANAWLLFAILVRTFASPPLAARIGAAAPGLAFAAAALWAMHPLATEAVVYASARSELLVATFALAALHAAIRAFAGGAQGGGWTAAGFASALLAVGSKENAASLPVAVLLYDRTFVSGGFANALRAHARLHAALFLTWLPLAGLIAGAPRGKTVGFDLGLSPLEWLYTQAGVLVHYLRLAIWPHPLRFLYDWEPVRTVGDALPELAIVAALALLTLRGVARRPVAAFPAACCFVLLAPTSSLVPIVSEIAAEKRMYLPLAALAAGGVAALWLVAERLPRRAAALGAACAAAIAILALATVARIGDYATERALWGDTLAKAPGHPWAHNNLGLVLRREGDAAGAEAHFRRALALRPALAPARVNLGNVLLERGDLAGAIDAYRAALAEMPDAAEPRYDLGLALARSGRISEALPHFEAAVRIHPQHRNAQVALARTYRRLGDAERAVHHEAIAARLAR